MLDVAPGLQQPPAFERDGVRTRVSRLTQPVSDHDDVDPALHRQLRYGSHQALADLRIESGRGFIQQEHGGLCDEGARERDALSLPTG